MTGTLHAEIHIAEHLVELALTLAQRIEELHPGLGVHAFIQACRFAGVPTKQSVLRSMPCTIIKVNSKHLQVPAPH